MAYVNFNTFHSKVKKANWTFSESKSSLANLYVELKGTATPATVRQLMDGLSAEKKHKYRKALAQLNQDFPPPAPAPVRAAPVGGVRLLPVNAVPLAPVVRNVALIENANVIAAPIQAGALGYVSAPTPSAATENYELIIDPDPGVVEVPPWDRVPPFTNLQIARINDSLRRAANSVDLAIKTLQTLRANSPNSPQKAHFIRFFGAFDEGRRKTILTNFETIKGAVNGQRGGQKGALFLIDARNDVQKKDWFAAAYRGEAAGGSARMFIGRAFFAAVPRVSAQYYRDDTDYTVSTLVHELAHACFSASDVPTVASGLVLQANGMPPNGAPVCNDDASDTLLAAAFPDRAIRNADNYSQFARYLLQDTGM